MAAICLINYETNLSFLSFSSFSIASTLGAESILIALIWSHIFSMGAFGAKAILTGSIAQAVELSATMKGTCGHLSN